MYIKGGDVAVTRTLVDIDDSLLARAAAKLGNGLALSCHVVM
jgi:Arc/MetJ family transcription regulator